MKISLPIITCVSVVCLTLGACGGSSGKKSSSSSSIASSVSSSMASSTSNPAVGSSSEATASSSSAAGESSSSESNSSSGNGWTLVWSDEFEGEIIDAGKWSYEKNCWGGGNGEQQCYTDQQKNAFIENGTLNIVAVKENFTGPNSPEGSGDAMATLPYTSARLRTKNLQEWTFGRFEIRAKLPQGQGTWPAIWMLPTDSPYGGWASGGEIDIVEAVNLKADSDAPGASPNTPESRVYGTLHYGRAWPGNVSSGTSYTLPDGANPADDFHTYALEWEEGEIRWYVDGVHYATQRQEGWYSQYLVDGVLTDAPVGAPYDAQAQYHLLLNLAVGGSWAGNTNQAGINTSVFPQTLQVDYVRVYECSASPQTGIGCATIGESAVLVEGHERPAIGAVELPGPPLFTLYGDELAEGLKFATYNPDGVVSYSEVEEADRGKVLNVVKTGANGNVYFKVNGDPTDLRNWSGASELVFDVKVNSKADGAKLLVKLDSGWPNVSDVSVTLAPDGDWAEYRITLSDLVDNGNSLAAGMANLGSIANVFVIDPSAAMNVSFDNIRIEGEASANDFAQPPLFTMYGDSLATGLQVQSYNPNGQISSSEIAETDRGKVFNVVKTGANGNVFFNVTAGPADLSDWAANGELVFDVKVNSKSDGAALLVKMDSGWPNVSDVSVTLPAVGDWTEYRISIADLIDNGNSVQAGMANVAAITNMFVIEPSGVMNVSLDNIRLVVEEEEFAQPPLFTMYEDDVASGLQVQSYNPDSLISSSAANELDRGNVFNVVKIAGGQGNVFFNITAGATNLSQWLTAGKLIFDFKVNSRDADAYLLVKMDSGWPNMSDVVVPLPDDGIWTEYSVSVADLINDGNHYTVLTDKANIAAILNMFVIEPQAGAMSVSFDNVRLVIE